MINFLHNTNISIGNFHILSTAQAEDFLALKDKTKSAPRQCLGLGAGVILSFSLCLCACGAHDSYEAGVMLRKAGFAGAVVADDSHAALVGSEVLNAGGSAFDAATAMGLTMSVTLPARAGLGAGGVCQFYNPKSGASEVLYFGEEKVGKSAYAVPALPRAMMALHAKGGNWRWEKAAAAAEFVAKKGFVATKTYEADTKGKVKEGDKVYELELAGSLALLRSKGLGGLYVSDGANRFISAAMMSGITSYNKETLRDFTPTFTDDIKAKVDNDTLHLLPAKVAKGEPLKNWQELVDGDKKADKNSALKLSGASGAAGFAVVDSMGAAVACQLSMGTKLYGTGVKIKGTGITPATALPLPTNRYATALITNDNVGEFRLVGYAGTNRSAADINKLVYTLTSEGTSPDDIRAALGEGASGFGVIYCKDGLPYHPESCQLLFNPAKDAFGTIAD